MVKEINSLGDAFPLWFTVYNDKLYFRATDQSNDFQLWVTDGSEIGTYKVLLDGASNSNPLTETKEFFCF